jgi:hypothetical protein
MKRIPLLLLFVASVVVCLPAQTVTSQTATGGFFSSWAARATATQSQQPAWAVPVVTQTTGLIECLRTDFLRQIAPARTTTWNLDTSKGANIIPWARTEFDINLPPYIEHNTTAVDGWGDFSFLAKYRFASGNEKHGDYTLNGNVQVTIPTGTYKNGAAAATVTPTVGAGKGFGNFDVQSTIGATLPLNNTAYKATGRPVLWNAVAQYKIGRYFWPEIESNATFYEGGTNDGKKQEFITPGLMMGRFKLHPGDAKSRQGLVAGAGFQIATSQFHSYNHELAMTVRWIF